MQRNWTLGKEKININTEPTLYRPFHAQCSMLNAQWWGEEREGGKTTENIWAVFVFKEHLSVVFSDPPSKDGNAKFTTVPLFKLCLIDYELNSNVYKLENGLFSIVASLQQ